MDARRVEEIYRAFVVEHGLERARLLESLRARFPGSPAVLYPGCFVHVTPSFFFQHVVYVDRNEAAGAFFSQAEAVRRLVSARQRYPQSPHIRFLGLDFTGPLPVRDESFDLLLALYAGGVSRACLRYLKRGGLLLSNDHARDALEARGLPGLVLRAVGIERREKVAWIEGDLAGFLEPGTRRAGAGTRASRYARLADYYLFERT